MQPEVLGDLVAPERRTESLAYRRADDPARSHTYESFCATAWQTANLLRLYGVHDGATVGVVDAPKEPAGDPPENPVRQPTTPIPEVLLAFVGAATLGSTVQFNPAPSFDGSALLCPAAWAGDYETSPGCTTLAYGGPPTDPAVVHFESEVWSETPIAPPESVSPDATALVTSAGACTHEELLVAAKTFAEDVELEAGDTVSIDAALDHPGTIAGGIVAPLLVGGTIQVGGDVAVRIGGDGVDPDRIIQAHSDERSSPA